MQEHRYQARDKTVKKMSRDGLTEENLRSRKTVRVSKRETESMEATAPDQEIDLREVRSHLESGAKEPETRQRKYPMEVRKPDAGAANPATDRPVGNAPYQSDSDAPVKAVYAAPEPETGRKAVEGRPLFQQEEQEAETGGTVESAENVNRGISEQSARMGAVRGHSSPAVKYAEAAAETRHGIRKKIVQDHARKERAVKDAAKTQDMNTAQREKVSENAPECHRAPESQMREPSSRFGKQERNTAAELTGNEGREMQKQPARMKSIRGHPTAAADERDTDRQRRDSKKRTVQDHARKERAETNAVKAQEVNPEGGKVSKEDTRRRQAQRSKIPEPGGQAADVPSAETKDKAKKERLDKEQKKKTGRLSFGDEENGMVRGAGTGIAKKTVSAATGAASVYVHGKWHEGEQDNAAVEGSHRAERMAESALRRAMHRTNRGLHSRNSRLREAYGAEPGSKKLQFTSAAETGKPTAGVKGQEKAEPSAVKKFWQKQRYKRAYLAARQGKQAPQETVRVTQTIAAKARRAAAAAVKKNKGIFGVIGVGVLLFALLGMGLSSCSALFQGETASIAATTYPSTDEDIYAVENAYAELESALNEQINSIEAAHPGYDEYRYQIDEISHNPYHLISYFTARYGEFTYEQVKDEVLEIFQQQYQLTTQESTETVTDTRVVRVGESLGQVVTSGYCSCEICCGEWAGSPTASGVYPTADHTIAVDADHPYLPMGTKVVMNGVEYVVEDTGHFAQYGVQFDVYYDDHATANAHGRQTWEAYIADDNGAQEVEVTDTREISRFDVTLTNRGLDAVLRGRMDEEEIQQYDIYNTTLGNRDYLFGTNVYEAAAGGFGYEIPAEALSDQRFANMIREAEKYLGYPYVWGGSSPETGFDCSGFVSWVVNNCGNGWNVGRCTAEELRGRCAYVSPEQAKPGDLIFFQGTYETAGASHVGIYVGDNMVIHCGNPIQYASISSYWQQHFMAFGRIQ